MSIVHLLSIFHCLNQVSIKEGSIRQPTTSIKLGHYELNPKDLFYGCPHCDMLHWRYPGALLGRQAWFASRFFNSNFWISGPRAGLRPTHSHPYLPVCPLEGAHCINVIPMQWQASNNSSIKCCLQVCPLDIISVQQQVNKHIGGGKKIMHDSRIKLVMWNISNLEKKME